MTCGTKKHLTINKYSGYLALITIRDSDGPIDLTGSTLQVIEAFPPALEAAQFNVISPLAGEVEIEIPEIITSTIRPGDGNFIRLGIYLSGGRLRTSPRIRIMQE